MLTVAGARDQAASTSIKVGDRVRVKPTVSTPKYKWGSVTHSSIGTVTGRYVLLVYVLVSGVISAKPWGEGRPDRRPFISTLEPSPTRMRYCYSDVCSRQ